MPIAFLVGGLVAIYLGATGKALAVVKILLTDTTKITPKNKNGK